MKLMKFCLIFNEKENVSHLVTFLSYGSPFFLVMDIEITVFRNISVIIYVLSFNWSWASVIIPYIFGSTGNAYCQKNLMYKFSPSPRDLGRSFISPE